MCPVYDLKQTGKLTRQDKKLGIHYITMDNVVHHKLDEMTWQWIFSYFENISLINSCWPKCKSVSESFDKKGTKNVAEKHNYSSTRGLLYLWRQEWPSSKSNIKPPYILTLALDFWSPRANCSNVVNKDPQCSAKGLQLCHFRRFV